MVFFGGDINPMRLFLFLLLAYKANLNIGEPLPLKANLFRKQPHESWQKIKERKKKRKKVMKTICSGSI